MADIIAQRRKAIVAALGAAVILVNTYTSFHFGIDPSVIDAIAALLSVVGVHQVPNQAA